MWSDTQIVSKQTFSFLKDKTCPGIYNLETIISKWKKRRRKKIAVTRLNLENFFSQSNLELFSFLKINQKKSQKTFWCTEQKKGGRNKVIRLGHDDSDIHYQKKLRLLFPHCGNRSTFTKWSTWIKINFKNWKNSRKKTKCRKPRSWLHLLTHCKSKYQWKESKVL